MTDEDVLLRLKEILGCGNVRGPYYRGKDHYKPQWTFSLRKIDECKEVMIALYPWLFSRRRARIDELIAAEENREPGRKPKEVCKNGHKLSGDNLYTWKNIRACRTCRNDAAARYKTKKLEVPVNG